MIKQCSDTNTYTIQMQISIWFLLLGHSKIPIAHLSYLKCLMKNDHLETIFEQSIAVFSGNLCALVIFLKMEKKQSSKAKANPLLLQLSYSFKESQTEGKYDRQELFILATGLRHPLIT